MGVVRITDERIETVMTLARRVKIGIERATFEGKRRRLEALGALVTVNEDMYPLKCIAGEKDGVIRNLKGTSIESTSY